MVLMRIGVCLRGARENEDEDGLGGDVDGGGGDSITGPMGQAHALGGPSNRWARCMSRGIE